MSELYHDFKPIISDTAKFIGDGHVEIGPFSVIEDYALFDTRLDIKSSIIIGRRCKIKQGSILRTYNGIIEIGDRTTIGEYTIIAGHGNVIIGKCCGIAAHCYISAQNHILLDNEIVRFQGELATGINIKDNVLISGNTMVLDGVTIEDGCIIGAGSVVTKSLPPNTVCYGNPCDVIRKREKPSWNLDNILCGR
jgi:acetyltransferase-like isoleucine patch superfamily enzyme